MASRLVDDNGVIDFVDDNGVACFVDDLGNFTCDQASTSRRRYIAFQVCLAMMIVIATVVVVA